MWHLSTLNALRRWLVPPPLASFAGIRHPLRGSCLADQTKSDMVASSPKVIRISQMAIPTAGDPLIFHFVMIKPTHYDDHGYPIQWLRSAIPSNTLACLNALAEDARQRQVLGPGVDIRLHTYDETNRRVRPERIIRAIRKAGGKALVGMVGVQSNQFPRAMDLARPFLAAKIPVCIGGFHVSGCLAMLPELPDDIREAQQLGISLFAGEAENQRLDQVLQDAWNGEPARLYNYMDALPALAGEPPPILPRKHVARTSGSLSSIDLGRGCPYQCSFCTIINVQGRIAGSVRPTISSVSCARTMPKASGASSSPTTISPATATGSRCSTG